MNEFGKQSAHMHAYAEKPTEKRPVVVQEEPIVISMVSWPRQILSFLFLL